MNTEGQMIGIIHYYITTISSSKVLRGAIEKLYNMTPDEINDLWNLMFELPYYGEVKSNL